jgi:hypothetical protein
MNLYQLLLFTRFDNTSSDEEFESAAVAKGVGKLTGDETDDEEKLYVEDDKDVRTIGKKSDQISGLCGVTTIVGGHVGQTHNPLGDNVSSNFVGFTSHLALNYDPPLGPFCEYIVFFVHIPIYELLYTNSRVLSSNSACTQIGVSRAFSTNRYVSIHISALTKSFKAIRMFSMMFDSNLFV